MNAYFFKMSKQERENILDQHKTVYDGYVTGYAQPKEQPLFVQDFANDKAGITVNNTGNVTQMKHMGINEAKIKEIDANTGSVYFPEESFDFGGPNQENFYATFGHEDKIGDSPSDLKHGTMAEIDELFDDEAEKLKFPKDYKYHSKDFRPINIHTFDFDYKDNKDKEFRGDEDAYSEFVGDLDEMDDEKKEKLKKQVSESLDMFRRFKKF